MMTPAAHRAKPRGPHPGESMQMLLPANPIRPKRRGEYSFAHGFSL